MKVAFGKLALGAALAATAAVTAVPAEARGYYGRHHGGGDDAAIAIGAGVVGLALGAALASDHRDRYYDDDDYYYDDYYYGRPRVYYSYPYPQYYYYNYNTYPRYYRHDRGWHGGWNRGYGHGYRGGWGGHGGHRGW
jgi:hypothetical protein